MRLNTKVRYAIRMMADVAKQGRGEPVRLKDVALRQDLPKLYLSQLAAPLKNSKLLKSVHGNKGGYVLGRSAAEIRLLDVFEAVDGPIAIIDCVVDPGICDRADLCECRLIWQSINHAIVGILERYTLADLMKMGPSASTACDLNILADLPREAGHGSDAALCAAGRKLNQRKNPPARKG